MDLMNVNLEYFGVAVFSIYEIGPWKSLAEYAWEVWRCDPKTLYNYKAGARPTWERIQRASNIIKNLGIFVEPKGMAKRGSGVLG